MPKNKIACCPECGAKIPFRNFIQLNNFSVINCCVCKSRIEICNRSTNTIMAGISGILSAASLVLGAYYGSEKYGSTLAGLLFGIILSAIIIVALCHYAYRHSQLIRN